MGRNTAAKVMPKGTPFSPGQSGNKLGRPRGIVQQIRELTNNGEELVKYFWDTVQDPKVNRKDRTDAAKWLGDRVFGKAPEVSLTGTLSESERSQVAATLADQELEAMARKLKPAPSAAPAQVLPMPSPSNPSESQDKPTD